MSLLLGRTLAAKALRSPIVSVGARRNVLVMPALGTKEEMRAEYLAQLEERVKVQKEVAAHKHSFEEEVKESWKWFQISLTVAIPLCVLSSLKDIIFPDHPHRKHDPLPDFMSIRSSPFPWECEDCELFNPECWKKCREEKAAAK